MPATQTFGRLDAALRQAYTPAHMSDSRETYTGRELKITYDAKRCLGAQQCVHGLPAVFDGESDPWIKPDGANAAEVVHAVCQCPTGALKAEGPEGEALERPDGENTIKVAADGPLYIRGDIGFLDPSEALVFKETRVALCRCGQSKNKPFCDDSHLDVGFSHTALALEGKYGEKAAEPGPVNIEPLANGPLFITGDFKLVSSDGKIVCDGNKVALCRCGLSENKPFCDGSHKEGGFEAPPLGPS